jgi:hypothetical protein
MKTNTQPILLIINAVLVNLCFLLSFLFRYGIPFPENNFLPYRKRFAFLFRIRSISYFKR